MGSHLSGGHGSCKFLSLSVIKHLQPPVAWPYSARLRVDDCKVTECTPPHTYPPLVQLSNPLTSPPRILTLPVIMKP